MKIKTLAIGLFADRIDMILCAGAQAVEGRRISIGFEQEPSKWLRQVRDAGKAVRSAAAEMGAIGLPARVFYRAPSACAEYVSPRARTAAEAVSAAVLACADSLACPLDMAASRACVVLFEKHAQEPKAHVVVAADCDDGLAAVNEMVEQAGLEFVAAMPIDAAIMTSVAQRAIETAPATPVATLYFGEHRSFLVIASKGSIIFARQISVGLDALRQSLMRPLRLSSGQSVELGREVAQAIIHDHGFPSRAQVVHAEMQLTGAQIVPVLQPVLQRFMVELRQSLRFALPEGQRDAVTLRLLGPGSRTPGFPEIIADELGVKVEPDRAYAAFDHREPASAGSELTDAMTSRRAMTELGLAPLAVTRDRRMRQMQRWLWTGAAAAVVMIGFDYARYQSRLTDVRKDVEASNKHSEGMAALKATADKLVAASNAMGALENTIRKETGSRLCMGAVMQELSRLTPASIRLFSVSFKPGNEGQVLGRISGYVTDDAAQGGAGTRLLENYMRQLGESPLLARLSLANVQATILEQTPAQTFDISFDGIAVPVEDLAAPAALAGATPAAPTEEHQP